jgi:uncharacterized membrane protein YfcA
LALPISVLGALVASFVSTLTGFGFALVSIPVFATIMDAKSSVVLTELLYVALAPFFAWSARREIDWHLLKVLLASGIVGLPVGTFILVVLSEGVLRLVIGLAIVVAALLLIWNYQRPFRHMRRAAVVVGFVTGVLSTSIAVSGPLVLLFLANQGVPKDRLRATGGAFLVGLLPGTFILFVAAGLITFPLLLTALPLLPVVILGYLLAVRALPLVDPTVFRRMVIALVLIAGLTLLGSEMRTILGI